MKLSGIERMAKDDDVPLIDMMNEFHPLQVNAQMACCGIVEVSSEDYHLYSKANFLYWLKNVALKDEWRGNSLWDGGHPGRWHAGILLATATSSQRAYKSWLKKVGFKKLQNFHNYNTGRNVSVWSFRLPNPRGMDARG